MKIICLELDDLPIIEEFFLFSKNNVLKGDVHGAGQFTFFKYKIKKIKAGKVLVVLGLESFLPDFLVPTFLIRFSLLKGLRKFGFLGTIKKLSYKESLRFFL